MSENHLNEQEQPRLNQKQSFFTILLDYVEIFVFAMAVVVLLFSFCFRLCTVEGESMENTLFNGESLVVSDLFYTPKQGDIIVFHQTGTEAADLNEPIVKRVIATEGETVSIRYTLDTMFVTVTSTDGKVHVLEENYIKYKASFVFLKK